MSQKIQYSGIGGQTLEQREVNEIDMPSRRRCFHGFVKVIFAQALMTFVNVMFAPEQMVDDNICSDFSFETG